MFPELQIDSLIRAMLTGQLTFSYFDLQVDHLSHM